MTLPAIASLWIGPRLRWLDRLSLHSFVARGHEVTLFHTHATAPEGVPAGVRTAHAREVWDYAPDMLDRFAPAPFADIFRVNMVRTTGAVWVDTDVLCYRPFELVDDRLYGFEEGRWINNAVLHLPADSPALNALCDSFADPDYLPEWVSEEARAKASAAPAGRRLAALSGVVPNALGPRALTHMLKHSGEDVHAVPAEVLNPVPWGLADIHFNPHGGVEGWLSDLTMGVHLFASRIRALHWRTRPYDGSFLARFAAEVGFDLTDLPPRRS